MQMSLLSSAIRGCRGGAQVRHVKCRTSRNPSRPPAPRRRSVEQKRNLAVHNELQGRQRWGCPGDQTYRREGSWRAACRAGLERRSSRRVLKGEKCLSEGTYSPSGHAGSAAHFQIGKPRWEACPRFQSRCQRQLSPSLSSSVLVFCLRVRERSLTHPRRGLPK